MAAFLGVAALAAFETSAATLLTPSSADTIPPSGSAAVAASPSCLLLLAGLFREFRLGVQLLQSQLLDVNPSIQFDVALLTSTTTFYSSKDVESGRASCLENVTNVTETATRLYATNHSRLISILPSDEDYSFTLWGRVWGSISPVLKLAASYDYVLMLRPDSALTAPLHLQTTCAARPDFSILSGNQRMMEHDGVTPQRFFNGRDYDFGFLACTTTSLSLAFTRQSNTSCCSAPVLLSGDDFVANFTACSGDDCKNSTHVDGYVGYPPKCFEDLCHMAGRFRDASARFGTLDQQEVFLRLLRCDGSPFQARWEE